MGLLLTRIPMLFLTQILFAARRSGAIVGYHKMRHTDSDFSSSVNRVNICV